MGVACHARCQVSYWYYCTLLLLLFLAVVNSRYCLWCGVGLWHLVLNEVSGGVWYVGMRLGLVSLWFWTLAFNNISKYCRQEITLILYCMLQLQYCLKHDITCYRREKTVIYQLYTLHNNTSVRLSKPPASHEVPKSSHGLQIFGKYIL